MINLQYLTSRSIDGLIISVSTETKDFSYLRELHERGMPIVFFDRIVDEIETHKVTVDSYKGAYEATIHLINNGYRRIAAVANSAYLSITKDRLGGYKAAMAEHGLPVDEDMIRYCHHGGMILAEVEEAVSQLLDVPQKPDAIFATSDKLTTGCLRSLKAKKISVPHTMGLVGFSNTDLTELLDPPLTIIKQPAFEMGELATTLLLQLIESKRPVKDFETKTLAAELIVRGSSIAGKNKRSQSLA